MIESSSREKALAAHRRALELWSGLLEEDSESIDYMYGSALSLTRIGSLLDLDGKTAEAMESLEQARILYERVLSHSPGVPQFYETYARLLKNYGGALVNSGQIEAGMEAYDTGAARLDELIQAYPGLKNFNPLAGDIAYLRGLAQQRLGHCDAALDDFRKAGAMAPDTLESSAIALATGSDGACESPDQARVFADEVVSQSPENPSSWRALGAVHVTRQDYPQALEAYTQASHLETEDLGRAADFFHMARCHAALGDQNQARQCHDQAVTAMNGNGDEALTQLRAASEALLLDPDAQPK
jgi:tetratricopeptide (TPR) repeat protein